MASPGASLSVDGDGVAVITLNNPPVNALADEVLQGLSDSLNAAHARSDVKAVVITGAGGKFCGGADITRFPKLQAQTAAPISLAAMHRFLNDVVEGGPKPTVAAVAGLALGGGLEVAMACNGRVAAAGASLGLPELTLGIIPGYGGTQRLPRLVGLEKALEMMLTSKPVTAESGLESGLVDAVVTSPADLLPAAKRLALRMAAGTATRPSSLRRTDRLPPLADAKAICAAAKAQAARTAPNLAHPGRCVDAVMAGIAGGGDAGLESEANAFASCVRTPESRALVHIFFAQRGTARVRGVTDVPGLRPRAITRVGVVGGGLMGSGIATALVLAGYQVVMKEINDKFLQRGLGTVRANIESGVKRGRTAPAAAAAALGRLSGAWESFSSLAAVDMVIEAALEDVALKQALFADLEKACPAHAILATNTSTIDIDVVGAKCSPAAKARILGAHFFSPAHVMQLLEIVRTTSTAPQCLLDTLELSRRIGKTPVVVGNCTGFAVNRMFFPYTMAACMLADLGADPYTIDAAIGPRGFGMPMGPFRLTDLVGGDIGLHTAASYAKDFGERVYLSQLVPAMNGVGRLGEKTGKGFYAFDAKRKASPAATEIAPLLAAARAASPLRGLSLGSTLGPTPGDVAAFCFYPVVNEACRVLAEGVVDKAPDADVASVLAMGFPPYRGGVLFWADLVGAKVIAARLRDWAAALPPAAGFFAPCAYLAECAASGRPLSAGPAPRGKL